MLTLYPAIKPYAEHQLQVDDIHMLHIEECGIPDGMPVLFLHGGPGGGCSADHRRFFDPKRYRVILFDQRGCGRSTPHASLVNNTTQDLIKDIEAIREHCQIEQWSIFGGSWGSTLALLYAQAFPKNVNALVLRGIFLCRQKDIDWFYQFGGASRIFPDHWEDFIAPIPEQSRDNMVKAYYEYLTGEDDVARMAVAKAWCKWEAVCATLDANSHVEKHLTNPHVALAMASIECHYFINKIFMDDDVILKHMHRISHIPGVIVHGRYDMICPLDNAIAIHQLWDESELDIIRPAGHAASEPAITSALIHAMNELAC